MDISKYTTNPNQIEYLQTFLTVLLSTCLRSVLDILEYISSQFLDL